jgi:hypothetical protein
MDFKEFELKIELFLNRTLKYLAALVVAGYKSLLELLLAHFLLPVIPST